MTSRTCTPAARSLPRASSRRMAADAVRQVLTFAAVGVVSTLAYVVLYALLRAAMPASAANATALVLTTIGNTTANRRLTFGVQGRRRLARDHAAGLMALGIALAITSASLAVLSLAIPDAGRVAELAVLVAANGLATLVRFVVLRRGLDHGPGRPAGTVSGIAVTPPARLEGAPR